MRPKRRLWIGGWVALLVMTGAPGHVDAAPPTARVPTSYFLAGDPHVPLAVVRGGTIASAVSPKERGRTCGPRSRWASAGSRWRAVDAWGGVVGTYALRPGERYDVTGCFEVSFASPPPRDRGLLFVSEDSAWTAPASAEWKPSSRERTSFESLLGSLAHGQSQAQPPSRVAAVHAEARFFEMPNARGGKTRMAVGGQCGGWLVASLASGTWAVVSKEHSGTPAQRVCYRPLAVFDMTGDAAPEIVLRFTEGDGESWGESVLQRSPGGRWTDVADSPGGSTA